jgi:hypothetical protein
LVDDEVSRKSVTHLWAFHYVFESSNFVKQSESYGLSKERSFSLEIYPFHTYHSYVLKCAFLSHVNNPQF